VRGLPVDEAGRLVENHFGAAWRSAFVGLAGLTPFLSGEEFFEPFSDPNRLFNHAWSLVGRKGQLRQIEEFLRSDSQRVAILTGRGGIGKTKVLHALSEHVGAVSEHELRFVAEGIPLTAESADWLPASACLMIVDDAHRREDIGHLLWIVRRRSQPTKLLLSARPYGVDHLSSLLTQAGFEPPEIVRIDEIKELNRDDVAQLARQALGSEFAGFADRLAAVTWDCPLVTVVGGRLLAEKQVALDLLERDEEFRQTVLGRFRDALVGRVSDRVEPTMCRSLLELTAAIGPFRLNNESLTQKAAEFLKVKRHRLVEALGVLEEAGVLLRRGYTLRMTPDVLADHVLHTACLTERGEPTGYAEETFKEFASLCPADLLRNLAELDWRVNIGVGPEVSLLANIWAAVEAEFREATNAGRCRILEILDQAAYYQPGRILGLVELAMRSPAREREDKEASRVYEYTHSDVLHELPKLLEHVGYTLDYLPRCCDLLWELGRDDARPLNQYPEHGMRVLQDLASYHPGRPVAVNDMVLDAVEAWLREPDVHDHLQSPLDVVDPMLAKTGHSSHTEGHGVVFQPFLVSEENTRAVRSRALRIIMTCAGSRERKIALRAIESLENALREPVPYFNMQITEEEQGKWVREQLEVLDEIQAVVTSTEDPVLHLSISKAVRWHARRASAKEVREKARGIIDSIPHTADMRVTRLLMDNWDHGWVPEEGDDLHAAREKHERELQDERREVAMRFLEAYPDAREGMLALGDRIRAVEEGGRQAEPELFLHVVAEASPGYAAGMCEQIIDMPDHVVGRYLAVFLRSARMGDTLLSLGLARRAVETGHTTLCRAVAHAYWWDDWTGDVRKEDLELIGMLLEHEDAWVKRAAIRSLGTLGRAHPQMAIPIAVGVEVGSEEGIAGELFQIFQPGLGIALDALEDSDVRALLGKLVPVRDIGDYHIRAFITAAAKREPRATLDALITRLTRAGEEDHTYRPLPFEPLELGDIESSPDYEDILREIRDKALSVSLIVREFFLPGLFRDVSKNFSHPVAMRVLSEWVGSGQSEKIEAASSLLKGAPSGFVFEAVDFVQRVIERAHEAGEECERRVEGHLYGSAISGTFWGTPGQPTPRDLALRDRASEVGARFPVGSAVRRFYDSLVEHAEASIRHGLARDEEWSA
jgi:hypothetical protein